MAKPFSIRSDFCIGDWLVQPDLVRLSRGTTSVRVRPQLMDVLVCLADRAGRTVTKDEVLASVWAGQLVTESAIARCISELRQTLGDDAHQPRFIETIPKRGYRLLAPLTEPVEAPRPADAAEPAPASLEIEQPPQVGADAAGSPSLTRRWPWLAGVGFAGALVLSVVVWQSVPAPAHAEPDILIVSVDNATGDPAFDETLNLALAIQIERSPRVRVLSHEGVKELLVKAGAEPEAPVTRAVAGRICRAAGARAIVAGSIGVMGRNYVIGLEAVACETGETLVRRQVEVTGKEQVLQGAEHLAAIVRGQFVDALAATPPLGAPRRSTP